MRAMRKIELSRLWAFGTVLVFAFSAPKCSALSRPGTLGAIIDFVSEQIPNFSDEALHPKYVIAIDVEGSDGAASSREVTEGSATPEKRHSESNDAAASFASGGSQGEGPGGVPMGSVVPQIGTGEPAHGAGEATNSVGHLRTVIMTDKDGRQFKCTIPSAPSSDWDGEGSGLQGGRGGKQPGELLKVLEGQCFYRVEDWWTYELCINKHVRQFHKEQDRLMSEYKLGLYNDEKSDLNKIRTDRSPLSEPHYVSQMYDNGEVCDLTDIPRSTEVRYVCSEEGDRLSAIREPSTCHYVITLSTPRLCPHPAFRRAEPPQISILCRPENWSPQQLEDARRNAEVSAASEASAAVTGGPASGLADGSGQDDHSAAADRAATLLNGFLKRVTGRAGGGGDVASEGSASGAHHEKSRDGASEIVDASWDTFSSMDGDDGILRVDSVEDLTQLLQGVIDIEIQNQQAREVEESLAGADRSDPQWEPQLTSEEGIDGYSSGAEGEDVRLPNQEMPDVAAALGDVNEGAAPQDGEAQKWAQWSEPADSAGALPGEDLGSAMDGRSGGFGSTRQSGTMESHSVEGHQGWGSEAAEPGEAGNGLPVQDAPSADPGDPAMPADS
eukprot:jgi/Botrbrau1/10904/Bobra.0025s0077.1